MREVNRPETDKIVRSNDKGASSPPKTSGAPIGDSDTSKSPLANRDLEGHRKAGTTPRPTDKPITGGDRG